MMEKISQDELMEILESYGVDGVSYETSRQVTPDSMIYVFSDKDDIKYVLYSADFLGGYEDLDMPHDFSFNDGYPYDKVSFRAIKIFSYKNDAKKMASGYIDDNHYWTKSSTGDVCMLFVVDELKI